MRQKFIKILHYEYQYPKNVLAREVTIYYGSKELRDNEGNIVRADIIIENTKRAVELKELLEEATVRADTSTSKLIKNLTQHR